MNDNIRIYDVKPILETVITDDVAVRILPVGVAHYVVEWDDGVANMWQESYTTRSAAFARLAVLVACGEELWLPTFADDADTFGARWTTFANESFA